MKLEDVQAVILTAPDGPCVGHLVLTVPKGRCGPARQALKALNIDHGIQPECKPCTSIGFTYEGLVALGLPSSYQRLLRRLAPAFAAGAVQRSPACGDGLSSAPAHWHPQFSQELAHVVVTWHGTQSHVRQAANDLSRAWPGGEFFPPLFGQRLGHPEGEEGEWVHFGFRDHLSEVDIDRCGRGVGSLRRNPIDLRQHEPGALLLGEVNDAGFNSFQLGRAPAKVQGFFRNSSFGIVREMHQQVQEFEDTVSRWARQLDQVLPLPDARAFVKAKLCGRWPNGRLMRPGDTRPTGPFQLDLTGDDAGQGCPFGSHVRRMRAAPDRHGRTFLRPLQRRSFPFGRAWWDPLAEQNEPRGQLGHFFCASIEEQFEHLLGQWATRPPLGLPPGDTAADPLMGTHMPDEVALAVPLKGHPTQYLSGLGAWTRTTGTLYAWHPGRVGLAAVLDDDYARPEDERPWL